ncbi:restriction endonuclease subunit S [Deferrisoma camini]|uniref:restriction endonuclease subunit S n=1 Tax=Deferrisoma camini TaxID=1035120 RepID=UPI0004BCA0EA|nr:restriction endonuclease subunit S [Deferrisoma camini]
MRIEKKLGGCGMGGEWRCLEVSELLKAKKLVIGDGYRAKNSELGAHGLPFARAGNINNGFRFEGADCFPEEGIAKVGHKISQIGDVVFTSKGTVGRFAFVRQDTPRFVYSPQLCFWRSMDWNLIYPRYLYYWMQGREFFVQLMGVASQTDMAEYVSLRDQRRMRITLPPLPEQRAIAHILGTLDDKIELNRRMNETLEAMAQALFKSWFVDFDPVVVNALRAGNPIPEKFGAKAAHYRDNPGVLRLPEEILRLFPDRFRDSELGPIPEGWGATTIGAEFDLTMGQSPPGSTYNEKGEGLPFFQGRRDFGFRYPSNRIYCAVPTRIARSGDTLVSVRAPVGDINMAYETCCIGRGVASVRHKSGSRSYTYCVMRVLGERFKSYDAEGTIFGAINKKQLQNLPIVMPRPDIISLFEELVYPLDESIRSFVEEMRALSQIRDTLLPKLISGELRVPDAERVLEAVG